MELLGPFQAVAERFKEQYKTLATALDNTRHELPVQAIHMQGSGQELLGRNSRAVWHATVGRSPKAHMHRILPRCLCLGVVLEPCLPECA